MLYPYTMAYSQKELLDLLKKGAVPGEKGIPKHIETVMSNVFLFDERAYKLYKNDNDFLNKNFVDLSGSRERFSFSRDDFEWNRQLAPEVYVRLQGTKMDAGAIRFVESEEDAEEFMQVTTRLPSDSSLFEHLRNNDLSEIDYHEIGKQFARREQGFVWHGDLPRESLLENMSGRHRDTVEWIKDVESDVPQQEREDYAGKLEGLFTQVYANDRSPVSICIDIHSMNAFYVGGTLYPFDTFSPKYAWHFGPAMLNVYRLAADVFALAGEKEFRAVMRGYHEYLRTEPAPRETEYLLVMYAALIMVSYLYMLAKTDPDKREAAEKYHDFLKRYSAEANFH